MAQIFHPSFNVVAKASIFGALFIIAGVSWVGFQIERSPYVTDQDVVRDQPVPFSHEHHVSGLGIDCRYCHATVMQSSFAGMPSTKTCMTCHSQIWVNAPMLQPVRDSWRSGRPIVWARVNNLPNYVFFDHAIHVNKGIGCTTCHGQVDRMPLMFQAQSLQMEWCLECHRDPASFVRPRQEVFNMNWRPPEDQEMAGARLVEQYHVLSKQQLTNCSICHR
jgi:hypothetical protein